jgi:hypothetical protein
VKAKAATEKSSVNDTHNARALIWLAGFFAEVVCIHGL